MNPGNFQMILGLLATASELLDEVGVGVAIMLTVTGLALHWYQPRHQMSVEERVKDSRMTEDEARRQMRFYRWSAPVVTLLGVGLMILAIYDIST